MEKDCRYRPARIPGHHSRQRRHLLVVLHQSGGLAEGCRVGRESLPPQGCHRRAGLPADRDCAGGERSAGKIPKVGLRHRIGGELLRHERVPVRGFQAATGPGVQPQQRGAAV